jgi:hypothetical protein
MEPFESVISEDSEKYFVRNSGAREKVRDPVLEAVKLISRSVRINAVMEIGCESGARLEKIRKITGANCTGLEASRSATELGQIQYPKVKFLQGVAPKDLMNPELVSDSSSFDCIILGFVSYLIPRNEIFLLSAYIDGLLENGGHLIIFDFVYPRHIRRDYVHDARLSTFKTDPSACWTWSPTYFLANREIYLDPNEDENFLEPRTWMTVDILRKFDADYAFPLES